MELINIFFVYTIALCSAVEDTQDRPPVELNQDLEEFIRRLTTHQQRQTTQNLYSAPLRTHLNIPRLRSRIDTGDDSPVDVFPFPLQSEIGERARSYASSSSSVKRPHMGELNIGTQDPVYSPVKDVNNEEDIENRFRFEDRPATGGAALGKSALPTEYQKSTTLEEKLLSISDDDFTKKGEPVALKQQQVETVIQAEDSFSDVYFVAIVAGCCAVGIFGVISAGICFYKLQKSRKAAADVDYPAYGVTGPNKDISSPNGDRKLAQSAQMYHYQHQKQQMIAVEKAGSTKNTSASDVDSEEENEEGDYTVYECPGLAPAGEMEVKNPLFHDDSTPVSPPVLTSKSDSNQNN